MLETNYTDKITALKIALERQKKLTNAEKTKQVSQTVEKTDLEQLFVRCVEDVRKEIIRRRLKAEVVARKKVGQGSVTSVMNSQSKLLSQSMSQTSDGEETQREFEDTLTKLAEVAKNRVKYEEFS